MTRADAAELLQRLLAPIPVAADPVTAVVAPCVFLEPASPFRFHETACWTSTVDAVLVAGPMDAVGVYDTLDALADTFCRVVAGQAGLRHSGALGAPEQRAIGNFYQLVVTFTLTLYDLGPGLIPT